VPFLQTSSGFWRASVGFGCTRARGSGLIWST
jgi:hypothetical protein